MKTIKFAAPLAELIKNGAKTSTWRMFDDKNLQVGDELFFVNFETGEEFGIGEVLAVREKKLGEVDDADFEEGHERYKDKEELLDTFRSYYGDKVDFDTPVKMIKFTFRPNK